MRQRINAQLVEAIVSTRDVTRDAYARWSWIILALKAPRGLDWAVRQVERARRTLPMDRLVDVPSWGHS